MVRPCLSFCKKDVNIFIRQLTLSHTFRTIFAEHSREETIVIIEKYSKFLIAFAYYAVIAALAFVAIRYALPMLSPFVIGAAIAYFLRFPIRFLNRKAKIPYKGAAVIVVLLFYSIIGTALVLAGIKAINWLVSAITLLPTMYTTHALPFFEEVIANLERIFHSLDPEVMTTLDTLGQQALDSAGTLISSLSGKAVGFLSGAAVSIPSLFIKLVLLIITTFFIAIDYEQIKAFCLRQLNDKSKNLLWEIKSYVGGTLWMCIRSYAIIMTLTFVELAIGLSIVKIQHAVIVALLIAIFDILPVLGTGGIMIPWTVLTAIQGDFKLALGLLIIYLVITIIRNIIEPKIVGGQLGLHSVVTLASMFAGAQLFGVIGLFGFPIGLSLLRHLNDHGVIKILK